MQSLRVQQEVIEQPTDPESSKRSPASKMTRNFRSALPSNTSMLPPEFLKRYDDYFEWFYSPSSKYGEDNENNKPPSYNTSQSLAQFRTTLPEIENGSFTAHIRELYSPLKKLMHTCTVFASRDSGYIVGKDEVIACHDYDCRFCSIIIKSFTATCRSFGAFSLRLERPGNVIRITSAFTMFSNSSFNIEIYRSVKGKWYAFLRAIIDADDIC